MAIVEIQDVVGRSSTVPLTFAVAYGSNNTAGASSLVIASNGANDTMVITDSQLNTYVTSYHTFLTGNGRNMGQHNADNIASGANTVTATAGTASGRIYLAISEVSGLDPTDSRHKNAVNDGNSGVLVSGNITTTIADCYLHGLGYHENSVPTPDAPWADLGGIGSLEHASQIISSVGTHQYSGTHGTPNPWMAGITAYKAAPSGPTPPLHDFVLAIN